MPRHFDRAKAGASRGPKTAPAAAASSPAAGINKDSVRFGSQTTPPPKLTMMLFFPLSSLFFFSPCLSFSFPYGIVSLAPTV